MSRRSHIYYNPRTSKGRAVALDVSLGYLSLLVSTVEQWSFEVVTSKGRAVALDVSLEYLSRLVSTVEQ